MVVYFHLFVSKTGAAPDSLGYFILSAGTLAWSGVNLFFVLSGFLIGGIVLDAKESPNYFRTFYTRRFYRIIPLYAVLLTVNGGLCIAGSDLGRLHSLVADSLPNVPYFFFLQGFWAVADAKFGNILMGATWSLAVEEQFYLVLPVLVRAMNKRTLVMSLIVATAAAPVLRLTCHMLWPYNYLITYVLMPCQADSLLLGVLAAVVVRDANCREWLSGLRRLMLGVLSVLFAGVYLLTEHASDFTNPKGAAVKAFGYTWLALLYACILLYAVLWNDSKLSGCLRAKWLGWCGSIAYGVYLFHQPILYAVYCLAKKGAAPVILSGDDFLLTLTALLITFIVCYCSFRFFEKPLIMRGHKHTY